MTVLLLDGHLSPEQHEFAETIRNSGNALLRLINDILDFSKIESGKLEIERVPIDVVEVIEETLELFSVAAAARQLELVALVDPAVPAFVAGDSVRLRQILANLVGNAVKFTEDGFVVVEVHVVQKSSGSTKPLLQFDVRDSGIGIPEALQHRLFQSFSQVDSSTTRRFGGTGLGLAISRRLSELMGGSMWVQSTAGTGSVFSFTIQAESAGDNQVCHDFGDDDVRTLAGRRLLLVEESEWSRHALASMAACWQMHVSSFAVATAEQADIDFAAYDVAILPAHDAADDAERTLTSLHKRLAAAQIPTVLVAPGLMAHSTGGDQGAITVAKPVRRAVLQEALLLALHGEQEQLARRAAARQAPVLDATLGSRLPLRLLLVEDNATNQKVALYMLGRMGYQADVAGNGHEAIDAILRTAYDVVLMDVQMPEMDGLEATRQVRANPQIAHQPVIVAMTAGAMREDEVACLAAGMDAVVTKPVQIEKLVEALTAADSLRR